MSAVSSPRVAPVRGPAWQAPDSRPTWPLNLALLVALLIGIGSLSPLLQDVTWWVLAGIVSVLVTAVMVFTRATVRGRYWPVLTGFIALGLTLMLFFATAQSLLGVIPTIGTLDRFAQLAAEGMASISAQKVPAIASDGITFLIALSAGVIAILLDLLGVVLRRPALAGIPLLVLVATASFVAADLVDAVFFILTGIAWIVALHVSSPFVNRRGAAVIGGASLATALVLQLVVNPIIPEPLNTSNPPGYTPGLNPIINLGENLRRDEPVAALSYTTDSIRPIYLTISTLTSFTQDGWVATDGVGENLEGVDVILRPPGMDSEVAAEQSTTDISIGDIGGQALPVPYAPESITGLAGEWRWNSETLNVRSFTSSVRGQVYTVVNSSPLPSLVQLKGVGDQDVDNLDAYLELPFDMPEVIAATALATTSKAPTKFEKALALQAFFRGPTFDYSESAPVTRGYDGTDAEIIAEFLDVRAGYCAHFSSAMAIMARTLGIPARVSVGFAPGSQTLVDGVATYSLTTDNLHAWPELYFEGSGWVRFEPTPGVGVTPTFPDGTDPNEEPTANPSLTPEPVETNTSTPAPGSSSESPLTPEEQEALGGGVIPGSSIRIAPLLIGLGLVLLLLVPAAVRRVVRTRRRQAARSGDALAAWAELEDTARDLRMDSTDTATPRELEAVLLERVGPNPAAGESLQRLRDAVERSVFANDPAAAGDLAPDLDAVRRGVLVESGRMARMRAAVAPASLVWRILNRPRPEVVGSEDVLGR